MMFPRLLITNLSSMSHKANDAYREWFQETVDELETAQEIHNFLEDEIHRTDVPMDCEEYAQEKMRTLETPGSEVTQEAYDDLARETLRTLRK